MGHRVCLEAECESESGLGGTRGDTWPAAAGPGLTHLLGSRSSDLLLPPWGFSVRFPLQGKDHPRQEELPRTGKVLMSSTEGLGEGDTNSIPAFISGA